MLELSKLTRGNPCHPPLIFLHGFLGGKEDWEGMITFFEDRFYCIAFDLPGHGQSIYSENILAEIKNALRQFSKPICIGYSMGGRIALQLQDCTKATVVLSAHTGLATQEEKLARESIDEEWCHKLLHLPMDAFFAEWYSQPIFHTLSRNQTLLQTLLKRRMHQNPRDLARVMQQMSLSDQRQITDFSHPALFLHGEEDLKYRQLYYTLPENVSVRSVKNCGHAIHLENAAHCAHQIINWIEVTHANT
jgi:2-succinyl-6-hydroxy-2,4-cyclohexadiene-1-carboxylate synthase